MNEKYVFMKDIQEQVEPYGTLLSQIKDGNNSLYIHLITSLEKSSSVGIRADVFRFFAEKASDIPQDEKLLFHLVNFSCNPKVTEDHISFVYGYFCQGGSDKKLEMDDFSVVFTACVEKDMPVSEIRRLFADGGDAIDILDAVDQYEMDPQDSASTFVPEEKVGAELIQDPIVEDNRESSVPSDVDMFNNLVSLMSYQDKDDAKVIESFQNGFNDLLDKLQAISSLTSTFSSEFMNSMKNDKDEIKRLNSMITLMKKLLSTKQNEIDELRGQIVRLNERIQASESYELRRNSVNEKIAEAYKLAIGDVSDGNMRYLP